MAHVHRFPNGLTLLAEEIPFLRSAAFALSMPAGCRWEPANRLGLAGVVTEMVQRGAGALDSRQLLEALDILGVDRSSSITSAHTTYSGTVPAEEFHQTLSIYADIVRRPHVPEEQLEDAIRGALLELQGAEDDLAGRVTRTVRPMHFGDPIGRDPLGTVKGLEAINAADVAGYIKTFYQPRDTILAIAGSIDWPALRDHVEALFGDWGSQVQTEPAVVPGRGGYVHLEHSSQQTHMAIVFPSVPCRDSRHILAQAAVGILGSGVSSRLFTRVREELGLCYSISSSYSSSRTLGAVAVCSGSTAARAQETLDVAWRETIGLANGISNAEVERLKVRLASLLVFEQESSSARASGMVWDWYHLERVVTAEELQEEIDGLTAEKIVEYWIEFGPKSPSAVTLGPEPLRLPWL